MVFLVLGGLLAALVIVIVLPILRSGTMQFSIPVDFRGFIIVRGNSGADAVASQWLEVPDDGIVEIASMEPFKNYYRMKVRWADGTPIESRLFGRENDFTGVAFWRLPLPGDGKRFYFYVGTIDELKAEWESRKAELYGVR